MCDYSLHAVATRPAEVGERLVCTRFAGTTTRGFSAIAEPEVAICLRPGAEIAFDQDVEYDGLLFRRRVGDRLARFRQIDINKVQHHDALEFGNGKIILLTNLKAGQTATVLQLPVERLEKPASQPSAQDVSAVPVDA